jgi:hypothetical protein
VTPSSQQASVRRAQADVHVELSMLVPTVRGVTMATMASPSASRATVTSTAPWRACVRWAVVSAHANSITTETTAIVVLKASITSLSAPVSWIICPWISVVYELNNKYLYYV